jgi:hypothetical protein
MLVVVVAGRTAMPIRHRRVRFSSLSCNRIVAGPTG